MSSKNTLPVDLPEFNKPVEAILKHFNHWGNVKLAVKMIAVNEDDCCWRFVEDGSELANEWNVIYWEYLL